MENFVSQSLKDELIKGIDYLMTPIEVLNLIRYKLDMLENDKDFLATPVYNLSFKFRVGENVIIDIEKHNETESNECKFQRLSELLLVAALEKTKIATELNSLVDCDPPIVFTPEQAKRFVHILALTKQ